MPRSDLSDAALRVGATSLGFESGGEPASRSVPVEAPVAIVYAPTPYAVMMASPMDLEDFAYGFSLTEGVIARADEIRSVQIEHDARGHRVVITLASEVLRSHLARARNLAGRTGCGVCGVTDIDQLPMARGRVAVGPPLSLAAARRALMALDSHLPLGDLTRATHGAAWCGPDGDILLAREDVGRHNALDKLIGALLRDGVKPADGFALITSRCSFEMVEKVAAFGARAILAISAPTSLAIERATALGVALLAVARRDGAQLFTDRSGVQCDLTFEGATGR